MDRTVQAKVFEDFFKHFHKAAQNVGDSNFYDFTGQRSWLDRLEQPQQQRVAVCSCTAPDFVWKLRPGEVFPSGKFFQKSNIVMLRSKKTELSFSISAYRNDPTSFSIANTRKTSWKHSRKIFEVLREFLMIQRIYTSFFQFPNLWCLLV